MRNRPISTLINSLLATLFCLSFLTLNGQDDYFISDENYVYCNEPTTFFIEYTNGEIAWTEWTIIPANGNESSYHIFDMDEYSIEVVFYETWGYWMIANSITTDSLFLSDTIFIEVEGFFYPIEVLSCHERNEETECYQVCSLSPTIIQLYQGAQFELFGAVEYNYIDWETIEVTWSDAGGSLYMFGQCGYTICFEIFSPSTSEFTTQPPAIDDTLTVCMNEEIHFENNSISGFEYMWTFGDGTQSNSFNATHSFSNEGFYTVTLKAESICDCSTEKQIVVKVLPSPAPTLDCVNSVCPETRQKYTATTDGCSQFSWSVSSNGTIVNGGGPGDDFIEVIWHEGPDGIINLAVSGCQSEYCPTASTFRIPIITPDGPLTGDRQVCSGEVVIYTAPYFPGTQYHWQIGPAGVIINDEQSNSISVRWNDVNTVTSTYVTVQYENCFLECSGSDNVSVIITPEIVVSGDQQVCQNGSATINAAAGFTFPVAANVQWHIEDENGVIVFTSPGTSSVMTHSFLYPPGQYYWVATNTSAAYCNENIRQRITVTAPPLAPLGIEGEKIICPGQSYGFTVLPAGNFATQWTIIDGAMTFTYQGQTCHHTFGNSPPYIVQALHADIQFPACVSDPIALTLKTTEDIIIEGPAEACINDITKFYTSYISGAEYKWEVTPPDHGEIKRTDLNQVEIFWTKEGPATVRLLTCNSILEKSVSVNELPQFSLTGPLSVCANEQVLMATDQPLLSHTWLNEELDVIGVAGSINLSAGIYSVSIEDLRGCIHQKPFEVASNPVPTIHLTTASPKYFCNNMPADVTLVANTDGAGYSFEWYKDDVSIGIGGPVYTVLDFGTYYAVVTNQYGCKAASLKIKFENCCPPDDCIGTLPGCLDGCAYIPHDFDILATGVECQSRQYAPQWPDIIPDSTRWAIYSASKGTLAVISEDILTYDYLSPGYYHIVMVGLLNGFPYSPSVCGHRQELNDTIRAVADFKHQGICKDDIIQFEDLTTFLPDEIIAGWSWDFDDPISGADNVSTLQDPEHIFSSAGDYQVTLTVSMESGCITSRSIVINIVEGPELMPVFDMINCENEALTFYLPGDLFDIQWNFGDPSSGLQNSAFSDSAFHTYELAGFYTASVSARDVANCKSQVDLNIDIRTNNLDGDIILDPSTTLCFGDTAILTSPIGGISWIWSTGETTEQITVTESSQFNVLVFDEFHCTYSPPPKFVEVNPAPEIIIKAREITGVEQYGPWEDSLKLCYGSEFEIQLFSPGFNEYFWQHGVMGDNLLFTVEGGNLPGPGNHQFIVTAEDLTTGCVTDGHSISIEIFDIVMTPVISLASGPGCGNNDNVLQVTNPGTGISYYWSDGQKGTEITTTHVGSYFVIATNQHGCTSQSDPVIIKPSPAVDQLPGGCFTACDPLSVCLPPLAGVSSYSIFHNGNLYLTGTSWPDDFLITEDGTYIFEITAFNGCVAESAPLDLILYPGHGSITVLTYLDIDGDGIISAADVLLPNIPVQISSGDGLHMGSTHTDINAEFVFVDFPASIYTASIDQGLLSSEWVIVLDSVQGEITTCGDSVVISLLLKENCTVSGLDQFFKVCPGDMVIIGDSVWTDTGNYVMHLTGTTGCDSVFQVYIGFPDSVEIKAVVWMDVDKNGVLSPADTVMPGIPIVIDHMINHGPHVLITDMNGSINGWFQSGPYSVSVDSTALSASLMLVYGVGFISDTACSLSAFNFLLTPSCQDVFTIQQEDLCPGDSILIEGNWLSQPGVYSFVLSQPGSGCDTTLDVYVNMFPGLVLSSEIDWNCKDLGSIIVTPAGIGPFTFEWGHFGQGDSTLTNLAAANYIVTVTDIHGCNKVDSFGILEPPMADFSIQDYYEIVQGDSAHIHIEGDIVLTGLVFDWFPSSVLLCDSCASTLAFPLQNTTIHINITDGLGCEYLLHTDLLVSPRDTMINDEVFIPNVFTPDGNGMNDRFLIFSRHPDTYLIELSIFDRWGTLLFNANEIALDSFAGWDGTFEGKELNPQVFTYKANYRLADGSTIIRYGDVTLLR